MRTSLLLLLPLLLLFSCAEKDGHTTGDDANASGDATGGASTPTPQVYSPIEIDSAQLQTVPGTEGGLQIYVAKEGSGKKVAVGDEVIVHYHGRLTNGKVFDSSYLKGTPFNVPNIGNAQVIRGWNIALPLLSVGTKAVVIIAPELGYGPAGSGPIPPNATLVFDIEVLDSHPMSR